MRAVVLHEFGPPSVLTPEEAAEPRAGEGQALIDVEYANVTFVETQIRAGRPPNPAMLPKLPAILGNGVGGRVKASGQRVIASLNGTGGYAERALAPAANLIEVPDELTIEQAVALLSDGRTALLLVQTAQIRAGERVLVEAAAGGVGGLLVQLAVNRGAEVIGAAGSPTKLEHVSALGAHQVVNYTEPGWVPRVAPIDVVFDGVGGEIGRSAFGSLRTGGRFVAYGMSSGTFASVSELEAQERSVKLVRGVGASPEQLRALARAALAEAVAGHIKPTIGQIFALERAAEAHVAIEQRHTIGKTLLVPT